MKLNKLGFKKVKLKNLSEVNSNLDTKKTQFVGGAIAPGTPFNERTNTFNSHGCTGSSQWNWCGPGEDGQPGAN